MRKSVSLVIFSFAIAFLGFSQGCEPQSNSLPSRKAAQKKEVPLIEKAANLAASEIEYLNILRASDWKAMYEYQAAYCRKKMPFEEFVYFGGKKNPAWKENAEKYELTIRLSGYKVRVPSMETMKKHLDTNPKYNFVGHEGMFPGKASKIEIGDNIQVSRDGKYGRIVADVDVLWLYLTTWMDVFKRVDFWDMEEGGWRVQLNRWDYTGVSGQRKPPGPEIKYQTFKLEEIIDYHLKKARDLYSEGKKKEAATEYLRAVELNPLEIYPRIPMDDPEIKEAVKKTVLDKTHQWRDFLSDKMFTNFGGATQSTRMEPREIRERKMALSKIEALFAEPPKK